LVPQRLSPTDLSARVMDFKKLPLAILYLESRKKDEPETEALGSKTFVI